MTESNVLDILNNNNEELVDFDVAADVLNKKVQEIKKLNLDEKKLTELIPHQDTAKFGPVVAMTLGGLALTESGHLTRTAFYEKLVASDNRYSDLVLTNDERLKLSHSMSSLTTGVNASVPLTCTGAERCPFAAFCPYVEINKVPVGRPCLVERDLLNYHTVRFIQEFDVDPNDHSEILLVQELSELIVYEMRLSKILAKSENAELFGIKVSYDPDGNPVEHEVLHWAFEAKEKIKNRRMRLLEAMDGTRRQKNTRNDKANKIADAEKSEYWEVNKNVVNKLDMIIKNAKENEITYDKENEK